MNLCTTNSTLAGSSKPGSDFGGAELENDAEAAAAELGRATQKNRHIVLFADAADALADALADLDVAPEP